MNQELQNYIAEEKKLGTSDKIIKQRLRDHGWTDDMFDGYFGHGKDSYLHDHAKKTAQHNKLIFIVLGIIIILGGGAYFAFAQGWLNFNNNIKDEVIVENEPIVMEEETTEQESPMTRSQSVLNKALSGEDFARLAIQYSEDAGSAVNGGDLGYVSRGIFVPEFDNVIFEDLENGEVFPEIIKSSFGYHIIKKTGQRINDQGEVEVRVSHILFQINELEQDTNNDAIVIEDETYNDIIKEYQKECDKIPTSTNSGNINDIDIENGWYYGDLNQKKNGTPTTWVHSSEGTRSARWYKPNNDINYENLIDCYKYFEQNTTTKNVLLFPEDYLLQNIYVPNNFLKIGYGEITPLEILRDIYSDINIDVVDSAYTDVYVTSDQLKDEIGLMLIKYTSIENLNLEIEKIKNSTNFESSRFIYLRHNNILILVWSDSETNIDTIRLIADKIMDYLPDYKEEIK